MSLIDPDRLLPTDARLRSIARNLYDSIKTLPILSPHGHCDPQWFAGNQRFSNPSELFVTPDHYVCRMLVSQGIKLSDLGIAPVVGKGVETDPTKVWKLFAQNYHLFRGTPSAMWLDHAFEQVFGLESPLCAATAEHYYHAIDTKLQHDTFLPRSLFERFNIELLATTEGALDDLKWHKMLRDSDWTGKVVTTYRPDTVVDPDHRDFLKNLEEFGAITGEDTSTWPGYLQAHRIRRQVFKEFGATATDHGHPTATTANLDANLAAALYDKVRSGAHTEREADIFRGQVLTEMARMSLDDGLTLQIHPGSRRNHSRDIHMLYGNDRGFDIPGPTDYVTALRPLLDAVGLEQGLTIIVFTLDETTYGRELAPLAGVYPALKLGPPWWFFDSYEGIKRFREMTTETCGFYNTVGFNDDTRAFCSIPARHDVSRRTDCAYLATLVGTGRLRESEAFELARELTYDLVKKAYKL